MKRKPITYLYFPLLLLVSLWLVKLIEYGFGLQLTEFGIYPRAYSSLPNILFAPFIHGSFKHLMSNSLPLFFLLVAIFYFYPKLAYQVIVYSWLLSGFGLWLGGRYAWHIGASGLVYAFASFLFFSGVLSKNRRLMAISLLVSFLYGGIIWGMFPNDPQVSWEAHLFGFVAGIILAWYFTPEIKESGKPMLADRHEDFIDYDTSWGEADINYQIKEETEQSEDI